MLAGTYLELTVNWNTIKKNKNYQMKNSSVNEQITYNKWMMQVVSWLPMQHYLNETLTYFGTVRLDQIACTFRIIGAYSLQYERNVQMYFWHVHCTPCLV